MQSQTVDRIAAWLLGVPLLTGLATLCAWQLVTWAPHYLTWPMWADHDVFATMAHAWDVGELPYRDLVSNNFPGTIYLFWILGRTVGWANTAALYVVDLALLLLFGLMLVLWSRRRFETATPGLVGCAAVLSYYLRLDFTQTAQRDWHGPLFALIGLLLVQVSPHRAARLASALAMASAVIVRPHTIVLLPALLLAVSHSAGPSTGGAERAAHPVREWSISFVVLVALGFVPLALSGVLDDFANSISVAGYGPAETRLSLFERVLVWLVPFSTPILLAMPFALLVLAWRVSPEHRGIAAVWAVAFGGALMYG
ncbi:MAG: hypothetical protein LC791_17785, partial [Acidobacteria bacterium]|nr:hypothetical protein [Acidobacteriota bacterium]